MARLNTHPSMAVIHYVYIYIYVYYIYMCIQTQHMTIAVGLQDFFGGPGFYIKTDTYFVLILGIIFLGDSGSV